MANGIRLDPAVELWAAMRRSTRAYYRPDLKKVVPTILFGVVIPAGICWLGIKGIVRFVLLVFRRSTVKGLMEQIVDKSSFVQYKSEWCCHENKRASHHIYIPPHSDSTNTPNSSNLVFCDQMKMVIFIDDQRQAELINIRAFTSGHFGSI